MIDNAKKDAEALREILVDDCVDFPHVVHTMLHKAADLIESLAAELEQVKRERDGLQAELDELKEEYYVDIHTARDPMADKIKQLEAREWDLFDLLSSAWFGKRCYFRQDDGNVYSRLTGEYMLFDQAIDELAHELTYDRECERAEPVRHGRWELETSKYLRRCSACEKVTFYRGAGRHYDYCPNCGARMDLEV
ncbi:MAG: hypothetical protein J6V38_07810 [Kiritimatiellae bacterium]|nr:hypothetical protein [Kiritimatiellia bacterium]